MVLVVAGSLFANRFEIGRPAGSGGMGTVYRARDRYTGDLVALKLLHGGSSSPHEAERFMREAELLSELRHPGIVAHVAHGQAPDGQRFLAMEWLEGEDLGQRLSRGPLPLRDCVLLLERVAAALDIAHQRGVVHRDIKPSNLFLPGGELGRVKLLDFGIARRLATSRAMTHTGMVIGTPEYMAPEQARAIRDITPAVDIFSVGCLLYECLAGQPPFVADHIAAVLVRILFEEPPPIEERRPQVPEAVRALLSRMLRKDPAQRLANGGELRTALLALGELSELTLTPTLAAPKPAKSIFAESEQDLYSVVLAMPPERESAQDETPKSADLLAQAPPPQGLLDALSALGASADALSGGALVATVAPMGSATDQATRAARAALLIKEYWPAAAVSIATGRGAIQGRSAIGEVVDRAVSVLREGPPLAGRAVTTGVLLDDLTGKLLGGQFLKTPRPGGTLLLGEDRDVDVSRPLLGKPTPCVGRESELATLDAQLGGCLDDAEPRIVVITALPGTGKSRLRHEFLRRVAQRREPVVVILGRGDLMTAGAPYGILGQALRSFSGVQTSAPPEVQRAQLAAQLGRHLSESKRARVIGFLAELCGIPFPDDASGQLSVARSDPRQMHDQIRRCFIEWLSLECESAGVLLVLDDLQWGDTLSIGLLDAALHELRAAPLCLLALARPELRENFPKLWRGHKVLAIPLMDLSRKACERLAQQILGKKVRPEVIARIVEQSTGNALFLEELIRAVGEGDQGGQAETVVAMLQARIGRFEIGPRRAVRAASVFGQTFWRGGIAELLGVADKDPHLDGWLKALVEAEIIEPHADSRLHQEKEYGFRHALVREAAYSLLTENDLIIGHKHAAHYLGRLGLSEPLVLAEHHRRGGELESAILLYLRAAQEASRMWALPEARQLYMQTKHVLDCLPDNLDHRRRKVDVLIELISLTLQSINRVNEDLLAEARTLVEGLADAGSAKGEDQRRRAWIELLTGRAYFIGGEQVKALGCYQRVLSVAEVLDDKVLQAQPSLLIGVSTLAQGDAAKGAPLLERAMSLQAWLNNDFERQIRLPVAYALMLSMRGRYADAMSLHEKVYVRATESKQSASLGVALVYRCLSLLFFADFQSELKLAQELYEYTQKNGDKVLTTASLSLLAWGHGFVGQRQQSESFRARSRQLSQEIGGRYITSDWFDASDTELALLSGDADQAIALAEQLVPLFKMEGRILALAIAEQGWGLALGRRDCSRHEEADAHLQAALTVLESTDQVMRAAQLRLAWADLCRRRASHEQATVLRAEAVAQYSASGCSHVIEGIERAYALGWPS